MLLGLLVSLWSVFMNVVEEKRFSVVMSHMVSKEFRSMTFQSSVLGHFVGDAYADLDSLCFSFFLLTSRSKLELLLVLNDEVSRKYIQSLKRLMTFAQTRWPPKDVSMLMG